MRPASSFPRATVIVAARAGRLGNRLFQAAHFMGNALTLGYRLCNPSLAEYASFFEGSARDPLCGFPRPWRDMDPEFASQCRDVLFHAVHAVGIVASRFPFPGLAGIDLRPWDEMEGSDCELCGERFRKLLSDARWILPLGWRFSDHAGMRSHRMEIIRYLTPVAAVRKPSEEVISRARAKGDFVIGVHIRQEDYRHWKNGAYYFEVDQYAHWMDQAALSFQGKKVSFIVCSSTPLEVSAMNGLEWTPGPGSPVGDLHALSLCDAIMGPPSTFSSWASYHGEVPLCTLTEAGQEIRVEDFKGY